MSVLDTPITYLQGLSQGRAQLLEKELGIKTFGDLAAFYPLRYVDKTQVHPINMVRPEMPYVQVAGKLIAKEVRGEGRSKRLTVSIGDGTGFIELVWFNAIKFIAESLQLGSIYKVFGKPTVFNGVLNMAHPEIEKQDQGGAAVSGALTLQPMYSSTEKLKRQNLTNREMLRLQQSLQRQLQGLVQETLPVYIMQKYRMCSYAQALAWIHFPADGRQLAQARRRLKFEELFFIQLRFLYNKQLRNDKMKSFIFSMVGDSFNMLYEKLPYQLTGAQKRVLKEIRTDTLRGWQMNRLVQGDVGSGKTIVALMSMLMAKDNGFQACMMAPTEILAHQHYTGLKGLLGDGIAAIGFLSGNVKGRARKEILAALATGELDILVGTHALIEEAVKFKNLGLAVIDEQHRFGVEQRAMLWRKNSMPPHVLVMTATPIPRTLAMSIYGDLDISVIDELPAGRKPITTMHLPGSHRLRMHGLMREEIGKGRQVYVVYPLIKESEKLDLLNLETGIAELAQVFPLPEYKISIVHGQLPQADKEYEMQRFVRGETNIMVATTVIEVGVNVPNATVMVIENAERFGLSQLHQLRGRVGRGADQSYCILMTGTKVSAVGEERINAMVSTTDGFKIAELDLKLRGPGDISGTMQSGVLDLKLADIAADEAILTEARNTVVQIFAQDAALQREEHAVLAAYLRGEPDGISYGKIS